MRLLRENKESLMAVLEAFVYDPLINWKLEIQPSPTAAGDALLDGPPRGNLAGGIGMGFVV
jgi:phosphatidylinositol kinase/protein kinase (PI-3  family)